MKHSKKLKFNKSPWAFCYVLDHITFDVRCNYCGCPVLKTEVDGYEYQCMNCDEELHSIETHKGSHYTDDEFNQLCLNTEYLLELDNIISSQEIQNKLHMLKKLQNVYAVSQGGVLALKEADDIWNDLNREIIKLYAEINPGCQLGLFDKTVTKPYTGQKIYNFDYNFIIPKLDENLKKLIENRLLAKNTGEDPIMEIHDKIEAIGGITFLWK